MVLHLVTVSFVLLVHLIRLVRAGDPSAACPCASSTPCLSLATMLACLPCLPSQAVRLVVQAWHAIAHVCVIIRQRSLQFLVRMTAVRGLVV